MLDLFGFWGLREFGSLEKTNAPNVLLVYKASLLRWVIEQQIRKHFKLIIHSSTDSSLLYIRSSGRIDCLVVELNSDLGLLDAFEITHAVRARFPSCPVLVFSGSNPIDQRFTFLDDQNKIEVLKTPFDAFVVGRKIRNLIGI